MINDNVIQIYGDSILKGVLLDEKTSRYVISETAPCDEFARALNVDIVNKSVFGCTVEKGSRLVNSALEKGNISGTVLLEYGGNDCNFAWSNVSETPDYHHDPITPFELFKKMYAAIVENIKKIGATPVLMSLPPIDAQRYLSWITKDGLSVKSILKWLGDVSMIYRFQELYSNAITGIAYKTNSLIIDVRSYFLDKHNYKDLLCADGIHPNEQGQILIKQALCDFFSQKAEILI